MKTLIKNLIAKTGYTIVKKHPFNPQEALPLTKEYFLDLYFSLVKDPFFVQIGAYDGYTADPIHNFVTKYRLKGICVEPQPDAFRKLQETYRKYPNVKCVNALIGDKPFYAVKDSGIATFNKKRLEAKGLEIEEIHPPITSLNRLLQDVEKVDFLQIDTEGYDYEILKMVDFNKFNPRIINLESHYFNDETRLKCEKLLTDNDYRFFRDKSDTCAYKTGSKDY